MASITNRKGKYYVVYWFDSFDGKRKQKWEQCENYEEAIFKKKKIEDEVNNQVFLAPSNQTIREFLETFVELYGTKHWGFNNYKANCFQSNIAKILAKSNLEIDNVLIQK